MTGRFLAADVPLIPDADEARRWAEDELSKPQYTIAEPTPLDRIAQAIGRFLGDLLDPDVPGGWDSTLAVVLVVLVVVLLVAAFLVWGMPRSRARSRSATAQLFGDDERSAVELRRDAARLAAAGEWNEAIVVRFRAIARALVERSVVETPPGATVHAFARDAARAFPAEGERLEAAAAAFDDVRYLRRPGTEQLYALVAATDDALSAARPVLAELSGSPL